MKHYISLSTNIALLAVSLLLSCHAIAQTKVSGTVIDGTDNSPMPGAAIQVKGAMGIGTASDVNGKFYLEVPANRTVLVCSAVGYLTQEVNIKGKTAVRVVLKEDSRQMDEVVVVGYGTMKKRDLSGSVGQIKGDDLMKGNTIDLAHGLQGKMAGVQVNQNDGAPGAGVSITVRGANSFSTSSQPLYIVDGIPFVTGDTPSSSANSNVNQTMNPLSFINPHDIESIEVLKDASATAIYGSRGANGVVLITTKRGKVGKPKVEFSGNFTLSKIGKRVDVLDAETYANYINEEYTNSNYYEGATHTTAAYPGTWTYGNLSDGHLDYGTGKYTGKPSDYAHPGYYTDAYGNSTQLGVADWQDEIYQIGFSQEYNVNVSGATEANWYSFSGNYLDQQGIIKNSGYNRYAFATNVGTHLNKYAELGLSMNFSRTSTDFAKTNAYDYSIIRSALLFPPTYGPDMDTTTADDLNWLAANPAAYVRSAKDNLKSTNFFSSSYLQLQLLPFLKFRQNLGIGYNGNDRGTYYDRHTQEGKSPTNGKAGKSHGDWSSLTSESLLTFDKTFRKIHSVNALFGFTAEKDTWNNNSMTATNFPDDLTEDNDMSRALDKATLSSDKGKQTLASFLGRVNYALMDRYLFTASIRCDGSSKFTQKNKWATFLSGAFAWRFNEEKFMSDIHALSNGKLRLSYGETGNQGIGSYRTLPMFTSANYPYGGTPSSGSASVTWRGPVSDDLKWETTSQFNAGLDIGFLKNRISLTVDYYYKRTRNLLQEVKIPNSTGYTNMMINSGHVTNQGLEIAGDFVVFTANPIKWTINANVSFNRNRIGGLEADQYANSLWYACDDVFLQRNGKPIGTIYGYVEDGFYDNAAEVRADPQYTFASDDVVKSKIGEIKYRDMNHDGQITSADRTIIGNTNPDFTYGITNNLSWKNFNLTFLLQGSQGNDIFNGNLMDIKMGNVGNIPMFAYNTRWTADNSQNAKWPKATAGYTRNLLISDRYVEDGSYLKMKNITLSYDWKPKFAGIENVNFSLTATNLFCITGYDWFDPDVNAFGSDASRRGVDIYSYPSARTYALGVKLSF